MALRSFIQFLKEEHINSEDVNIEDVNIHDKGRRRKELSKQDLMKKYDFLKKEPKYIKQFHEFSEKEGRSEQELKDLYKGIQTHRNTLKQNKVDLSKATSYEEIDDELTKMKLIEKTNKFVKLLPSSLRKEMKSNHDYLSKFSDMLIDYNYDDYKNSFLKKVARYKTGKEFLEALENHISSFAPKSELFKKIEDHNSAEIVHSTDDYLVARIYSRDASMELGSQQWCISQRTGSYWDSYISGSSYNNSDGSYPGVQYFIWDFTFRNTDNESMIGCTMYRKERSNSYSSNKIYVAHSKNDSSININNKQWYRHLVNFDHLDFQRQVKLVSENPKMEEYTGIIDRLSDDEKRNLLKEIPRLLNYFVDLSFLTNSEIWDLVKKDKELTKSLAVANELNDDQKALSIIKNPDLLDEKWDVNPYRKVTRLLTRKQRIEMISNKHSLYPNFNLTEDEKFELINLDPKIIVSYTEIIQEIDQRKLKEMYLSDKDRWDNQITSSKSEKKTKIELALKHLVKSDDRLEMETSNKVYILISTKGVINGKEYYLPDNSEGVLMIGDILDPHNDNISSMLLVSSFDDSVSGYWVWIPQNLISMGDLKGDRYIFSSSYEDIVNGDASDKDIEVFKHLQTNMTLLG